MKPYKLNEDERESLSELLISHGWESLLIMVEAACAEIDSNIMRYTLGKEQDQLNLVVLKAKSEGARSLQLKIQQLKKQFKEP